MSLSWLDMCHVCVTRGVFFSSSWLCCCNYQKELLQKKFWPCCQCKHSGTGQGEIKIPCILFYKGIYSPRLSWVDSWKLFSSFVPARPKAKMRCGSLTIRSSLCIQRTAQCWLYFHCFKLEGQVKWQRSLYEKTQSTGVRSRPVGDFKVSGCFEFFRMFPDHGRRANHMLNYSYL